MPRTTKNTVRLFPPTESISDRAEFGELVACLIQAESDFAEITDEKSTEYRIAQAGVAASWNALTGMIDAYNANSVLQALAGL